MDASTKASLKAELKAYERAFKQEHGKAPSAADIKADSIMSAKYKQYNAKPVQLSNKEQSDPFAANAGSNDQTKVPIATSRVEHAPSPSRLQSMISARSFTGSPNKKTTFSPLRAKDTPRTKARKWLGGGQANDEMQVDWKQPMSSTSAVVQMEQDDLDLMDQDSPVKPQKNGKAYQPLFDKEMPKLSFGKDAFKAPPSIAPPSSTSASQSTSKPRLITDLMSAKAQDSVSFESDKKRFIDTVEKAESQAGSKKSRKNPSSRKGKKKAANQDVGEDEGDEADVDLADLLQANTMPRRAYHPYARRKHLKQKAREKAAQAGITEHEGDPDDEDYASLDDEDFYHLEEPLGTDSISTTSAPVVPAHLVSLLSLDASPIKKHRQQVQLRKADLVKRVLNEPSILKAQRRKTGLEDLEDDLLSDEHEVDADSGEGDDDWESEPDGWKDLAGNDLIGLEDDDMEQF